MSCLSLSFTVLQGKEGVRGIPGAPGEKVSVEHVLITQFPQIFFMREGLDQECSSVVPLRENKVLQDQQGFQDLMGLKGKRSVDISSTEYP